LSDFVSSSRLMIACWLVSCGLCAAWFVFMMDMRRRLGSVLTGDAG
jgi:hypothetical protein